MTLGRRCDEIVRIIDETLASVAPNPAATVDVSAHPSAASLTDRVRSSPAGRDRRAAGRLRLLRDPAPVEGPETEVPGGQVHRI